MGEVDIEYKNRFEDIVNKEDIQKLIEEKATKIPGNAQGQYAGVIYWDSYEFTKKVRENLKPEFSNVTGFHIKPYCITTQDIKKAKPNNESKFKEQSLKYIDYDEKTGNFHKYTQAEKRGYQIVLVINNGPGFKKEYCLFDKKIKYSKSVKTDWYFPPIEPEMEKKLDDDTLKGDLLENLKKCFETIFKEKTR